MRSRVSVGVDPAVLAMRVLRRRSAVSALSIGFAPSGLSLIFPHNSGPSGERVEQQVKEGSHWHSIAQPVDD